ncbi:hypothetical protein [Streptomyces sp. NPDC047434]|uniref:hypothetical protein n=1 Tax=Streptomyces sp. NPDC047434 TaxID=3155143 RepID=UPI0033C0963C
MTLPPHTDGTPWPAPDPAPNPVPADRTSPAAGSPASPEATAPWTARLLHTAGHRVVAVDQRGHGHSERFLTDFLACLGVRSNS